MIEPIMYIAIGFLVAGLLVIGIIPLVHARAVRLTMRRLEALTPLSMAEIQAEKDQLRAEFAMSTRRLEMSVEQLKAKTTSQASEIGRKSDAIGRLKLDLGEKTAALVALEAKEAQLAEDLQAAHEEIAGKDAALDETKRFLAEREGALAEANTTLHQVSLSGDSQRVELIALRAQAEVLKGQIESAEQEAKELRGRLERRTREVQSLEGNFAEERGKGSELVARIADFDRQMTAEKTEAELLQRRVQELTARLDEQARSLAERESASDRLRDEAQAAQNVEAQLRAELASAESRHRDAAEAIRAEKALIEGELKKSQEERANLEREIASLKREAEGAWANERMENAVLRERINDVAAEVARLTAALEGPSSPINAILGGEAARPTPAGAGRAGNGGDTPSITPLETEAKGTLADRIRALQRRASQTDRSRN